jgi:AcrR family transcriptional regulator
MPAATPTRRRSRARAVSAGAEPGRQSADERREQVLKAAVAEFAIHGLHGTSTESIAKRTKISQPYIFRLFPSKKDLFLAAIDRCFDRVEAGFTAAAKDPRAGGLHEGHLAGAPLPQKLHAIGHAYVRMLAERELLLFQMQAYAACSDEDVRRLVRRRWEGLVKLVGELSGARSDELTLFFARGMLLNVIASIGLVPEKAAAEWGHKNLGFA